MEILTSAALERAEGVRFSSMAERVIPVVEGRRPRSPSARPRAATARATSAGPTLPTGGEISPRLEHYRL